jgi:hypothetical protein
LYCPAYRRCGKKSQASLTSAMEFECSQLRCSSVPPVIFISSSNLIGPTKMQQRSSPSVPQAKLTQVDVGLCSLSTNAAVE